MPNVSLKPRNSLEIEGLGQIKFKSSDGNMTKANGKEKELIVSPWDHSSIESKYIS